jgi:streptogramin lyase
LLPVFALAAMAIVVLLPRLIGGSPRLSAQLGDPNIDNVRALQSLPAPAGPLVVDSKGIVWFPLLGADGLVRDDGQQDNRIYRYDSASDALTSYKLPGYGGVTTNVRVVDNGTALLVAWGSNLMTVNKEDGSVKEVPLPSISDRSFTRTGDIEDIVLSGDTIWLARSGVSSLWSLRTDGSVKEYPLPAGLGHPHRLALGSDGHVWMSLIGHAPVGPNKDNAFAITAELNPATAAFVSHEMPSGALAADGDSMLTVGGGVGGLHKYADGRAQESNSIVGTEPDDFVAVDNTSGTVWYTSFTSGKVAAVSADGQTRVASLPTFTGDAAGISCPPTVYAAGECPTTVTAFTLVGGIAIDSQDDLWFSSVNGRYIARVSLR